MNRKKKKCMLLAIIMIAILTLLVVHDIRKLKKTSEDVAWQHASTEASESIDLSCSEILDGSEGVSDKKDDNSDKGSEELSIPFENTDLTLQPAESEKANTSSIKDEAAKGTPASSEVTHGNDSNKKPTANNASQQATTKEPVADSSKPTGSSTSAPSSSTQKPSSSSTEKPASQNPSEGSSSVKPGTPVVPKPEDTPIDKPQSSEYEQKHSHSYAAKITKEATCTCEGVKTFTCSCGDSYTESIPKAAHSYVTNTTKKWVVDRAAYDEQEKITITGYKCNECGMRFTSSECKAGLLTSHQKETDHAGSSSYTDYSVNVIHHDEEGHYEESSSTVCSVCGNIK